MKHGMTTEDFDAILEERGCDCAYARPRDRLVDDEGNPLPPRYEDLEDVDKGLLWLAHHEGRVIQFWHEADWMDPEWYWEDDDDFDPAGCRGFSTLRYRVKPEPEPEPDVDDEGNRLPPVYYDLTLGDKGRLLWFADHGSRGIQAWNELDRCWEDDVDPLFYGRVRYRVKPEPEQTAPVRQPVQIQGPSGKLLAHGTMIYRDGEWDFDSLEVDNQPDTN